MLSEEALQAQEAAELRDRENMPLVNANAALPVNAAVALNALVAESGFLRKRLSGTSAVGARAAGG